MSSDEVAVFLTPLYSAARSRAVCYVLDIDDCRLLLDCGWSDAFDPAVVSALRSVAGSIDAVLLSHASLEHAGALPALISQLRAKCSVFATQPVFRFGHLVAYDTFFGRSHDPSFAAFSLDDADTAYKARERRRGAGT